MPILFTLSDRQSQALPNRIVNHYALFVSLTWWTILDNDCSTRISHCSSPSGKCSSTALESLPPSMRLRHATASKGKKLAETDGTCGIWMVLGEFRWRREPSHKSWGSLWFTGTLGPRRANFLNCRQCLLHQSLEAKQWTTLACFVSARLPRQLADCESWLTMMITITNYDRPLSPIPDRLPNISQYQPLFTMTHHY